VGRESRRARGATGHARSKPGWMADPGTNTATTSTIKGSNTTTNTKIKLSAGAANMQGQSLVGWLTQVRTKTHRVCLRADLLSSVCSSL